MADTILHPEHCLIRFASASMSALVERLPILRGLHRWATIRLLKAIIPDILTMLCGEEVERYIRISCRWMPVGDPIVRMVCVNWELKRALANGERAKLDKRIQAKKDTGKKIMSDNDRIRMAEGCKRQKQIIDQYSSLPH